MLLRNIPHDSHDIFTAMSTSAPTRHSPTPPPPQTYPSDVLSTTHEFTNNNLDDVWGDADNDNPGNTTTTTNPIPGSNVNPHPSDIPRLRQEHSTAGYRDGITVAKAKSVQAGFDEGFGLGATIGLRAGELVGVLEGLVNALSSSHAVAGNEELERLKRLLEEAKKELGVQVVFGSDYWEEDGTWKYEVPHPEGEAGTVFGDVATAHPMLASWDGIVKREVERYGVSLDVLKEEAEEERRREEEHGHLVHAHEKKGEAKVVEKGKGALEW